MNFTQTQITEILDEIANWKKWLSTPITIKFRKHYAS